MISTRQKLKSDSTQKQKDAPPKKLQNVKKHIRQKCKDSDSGNGSAGKGSYAHTEAHVYTQSAAHSYTHPEVNIPPRDVERKSLDVGSRFQSDSVVYSSMEANNNLINKQNSDSKESNSNPNSKQNSDSKEANNNLINKQNSDSMEGRNNKVRDRQDRKRASGDGKSADAHTYDNSGHTGQRVSRDSKVAGTHVSHDDDRYTRKERVSRGRESAGTHTYDDDRYTGQSVSRDSKMAGTHVNHHDDDRYTQTDTSRPREECKELVQLVLIGREEEAQPRIR